MYTFYTDKNEDFKCQIDIEGADINDINTRLVFKNSNMNLMFEGQVDSSGNCVIPVTKFKNILKEQTSGDVQLEVIAEDTFFIPWEDTYEIKTSKKVTVEVLSNENKSINENKVKVKVARPIKEEEIIEDEIIIENDLIHLEKHSKIIAKLLAKKGIDFSNLMENEKLIGKIIKGYKNKLDIKFPSTQLLKETLIHLK